MVVLKYTANCMIKKSPRFVKFWFKSDLSEFKSDISEWENPYFLGRLQIHDVRAFWRAETLDVDLGACRDKQIIHVKICDNSCEYL